MVATQDVSMSAVEVMRNREIMLQVPSAGCVDRLDLRCEREREELRVTPGLLS